MTDNSAKRGRSSTVIATRVNWLGNRLVTTASATYGQIGLGFLDARLLLLLGRRPDITAARIVSSDLGDPEFESKLLARVRLFRFDAKDVATLTATKPIDFFPAG